MYLVDSNIIIYAINITSPKHQKAQEFLLTKTEQLAIAQQNILEAMRVLTHPKFSNPMSPQKAIKAVTTITDALDIISPNYKTIHITLALLAEFQLKADQIFDTYLTATALSNDITTIATDNIKDFQIFPQITLYNPFQ